MAKAVPGTNRCRFLQKWNSTPNLNGYRRTQVQEGKQKKVVRFDESTIEKKEKVEDQTLKGLNLFFQGVALLQQGTSVKLPDIDAMQALFIATYEKQGRMPIDTVILGMKVVMVTQNPELKGSESEWV